MRTSTTRRAHRVTPCMFATLAVLLVSACTDSAPSRSQPEGATGTSATALVVGERAMAVAAHPVAAEAGREILRAGGTAADAAIATMLVLGLVEPQSSGLGGGAFLLDWNAASRTLTTWDGRETAPAAARPDRFLRDGRPMPFDRAVRSGLSVGTPGAVRLMESVHAKHGMLPWARLFEPSIRVATVGFAVSPRLHALLATETAPRFSESARRYFFDASGRPWPVGHVLRNPQYAATMERIARAGAAAFYTGDIAAEMVAAVAGAQHDPGDLSLADLADYRALERRPVCARYRGLDVCGMGPPSSGAVTVGQALMLLEGFELGRGAAVTANPGTTHLIAEALKLGFADRDRYLADPDQVTPPAGLLDRAYLAERRKLMSPTATLERPTHGIPPGIVSLELGDDETREIAGTTHVSVVDAQGNAVAVTATIESGFGSRLWAAGFLLNNQLTDFSFRPTDAEGRAIANRIEPGKRPRSSMSPTIVFDATGAPLIVTGSPGGSRIIPYVVKTLVAMIDGEFDAAAAAALPNIATQGRALVLESPGAAVGEVVGQPRRWFGVLHAMISAKALGQTVRLEAMTSGVHTIVRRRDGRLDGGADPRREGVALGD